MYFKQKTHTGKYERLKWYIQRSNLRRKLTSVDVKCRQSAIQEEAARDFDR